MQLLPRIPTWVREIIIVDGASVDATVEVAREHGENVRIVLTPARGKGAALRVGFQEAVGDVIVALDADGSTDPAEISAFVGLLASGADVVMGSRFAMGGGTTDMELHRRIGNWSSPSWCASRSASTTPTFATGTSRSGATCFRASTGPSVASRSRRSSTSAPSGPASASPRFRASRRRGSGAPATCRRCPTACACCGPSSASGAATGGPSGRIRPDAWACTSCPPTHRRTATRPGRGTMHGQPSVAAHLVGGRVLLQLGTLGSAAGDDRIGAPADSPGRPVDRGRRPQRPPARATARRGRRRDDPRERGTPRVVARTQHRGARRDR